MSYCGHEYVSVAAKICKYIKRDVVVLYFLGMGCPCNDLNGRAQVYEKFLRRMVSHSLKPKRLMI